MNACPRCSAPLDEGPILYRCGSCRRAVYAADLNTEYQPHTLTIRPAPKAWP